MKDTNKIHTLLETALGELRAQQRLHARNAACNDGDRVYQAIEQAWADALQKALDVIEMHIPENTEPK